MAVAGSKRHAVREIVELCQDDESGHERARVDAVVM